MATPEQQAQAAAAGAEAASQSLLDQIVEEGRFGKEADAKRRGREMISQFVKDVLEGAVTYSADTEAMLTSQIAEIDRLVSAQLNEIMHHEKFQKLEATWTGLRYLVSNTETGPMLKIRVLSIPKADLLRDLTKGRAAMGVDRRTGASSSARSTRTSTTSSAATPTGRFWETTSSTRPARTSSCWRRSPRSRQRRTRLS
jgi:predicted component of type VI protein secretion system